MVGLEDGLAEQVTQEDSSWMITGQYGVIQYSGIS